MLDSVVVGRAIQKLREQKHKSREVISGLAGIGRTHLSAIERGERKPTSPYRCVGNEARRDRGGN